MIKVSALKKSYSSSKGEVFALRGVDLSVAAGEFVAIIGKSGSGKSTLMNLLGCLDTDCEGEYILNGRSVLNLSKRELSVLRNREIGFIFQGFNLLPGMTALENVELPLIYAKVPQKKRRELSEQALCRVGLENRMAHRPSELSGGQQQRVAIARAIAASPSVILADEPTGNLDPASTKQILDIISELKNDGSTVVLITHDMSVARSADRILEICDGRIVN